MPSLAGQKLDKYDMLEEVGHGGMAVVYRGRDTILDREVAVKVLHAHLAGREESRRRLQREAKTVAKLHHDNIVEIFDSSDPTEPGESYIVCEFIHGITLRDWLDDAKSARPVLAAMIIHRLCLPLEHAHSLGIVHRDIKPENVMIRKDGCLKLMDFGIAQILDTQRLTTTGQLLGSPAYMAPELISGKPVDKRIDIFALGVMLYQLATGELPFSGRNPAQVLNRILEGDYKPPAQIEPKVDDDLAAIIAKALALSSKDRYQTAQGMAKALEEYLAQFELEVTSEELERYFADPEAYIVKLDTRVCRVLMRGATKAMRAGQGARALKLLGRVLEIDPSNKRAASMLDKVRVRGQRMRQIAAAAGLLAAIGIVTASVLLIRPDPPKPERVESEDPLLANGAYSHIPIRTPLAPAPTEAETGDSGSEGELDAEGSGGDEIGEGGAVGPSGTGGGATRPPRDRPNCRIRVDGLPAAVLAGGDYSLSIAGTHRGLPTSGELKISTVGKTKVSLIGDSYSGVIYVDEEHCKSGTQVLRARTRPAVLNFQAGAIPLEELSVTCKSGCSVRDRPASSFPSLPFPKNSTEMVVVLVFRSKHYSKREEEIRLYPGKNKVVVSLQKL